VPAHSPTIAVASRAQSFTVELHAQNYPVELGRAN
jgi:hypothetical protein